MTDQQFRTLAYTKSPKTSRRTTFQDELQAAVSSRASRARTDRFSYSDDFNEDEDDFLNELLKSRKKKAGALKATKSKSQINDFEISDDEGKPGRTKRVSFLKAQKLVVSSSSSEDTTASQPREQEPADSSSDRHDNPNSNDPASIQRPTDLTFKSSDVESTDGPITRQGLSKSLSHQTSDDTLLDTSLSLPLPSDHSVTETPGPEETRDSLPLQPSDTDVQHASSPDATQKEPPRPKPRQRTLGLSLPAVERIAEDAEPDDVSAAQTSSASIPLSTDMSGVSSWTGGGRTGSCSLSKSSSKSELSQLFTTDGSRDGVISEDSKEQEMKYSTSFEEFHEDSGDHLPKVLNQTFDARTSSSRSEPTQRSQSACSSKVESKYLGSLKLLDRKVSLDESQPQAADSIRAAVYQQWLQKKKEKSRENMRLKKKEELLKEKKQKEEEAKKEDAVASYEAWKKKKAESLKEKAKEKLNVTRKEQRDAEEKEEKKQSAKQVFERWKRDHDHLLKEKFRKQKEAERKLQFRKQEKQEERLRDSKSAFSDWCEQKNVVLHKKATTERGEGRTKAEEERYMKEERDKMALEMYEHWLVRKDLEQKRQREERRIQAILQDSPPPPWSPPNKTIPFRK